MTMTTYNPNTLDSTNPLAASEYARYRIHFIKFFDTVRRNDDLLSDKEFTLMLRNYFWAFIAHERKYHPEQMQLCFNQLCEIDIYE